MGRREKKKLNWKILLIEIVVIAVLIAIMLKLVEYWTGVNPIDNLFQRKNALSDISEVASVLTEALDEGKDEEMVLYIKDIPEKDLQNINYIMSNLNGSVDSFQIHPKIFGVQRVSFKIIRSDNSFVYDAYKNGAAIPEDRKEAQKLLVRVNRILEDQISPTMSDYQKELALHDYLLKHCVYGHGSEDKEYEYRAYGALVEGQAVCNGYAEAMALLLSCAGVENRYVVGTANSGSRSTQQAASDNGRTENHAWNLVRVNGTWYHLDSTWDDPVGEKELVSHAYFNVSDEVLRRDHSWNEEKYEVCPDMSWNYFFREHTFFDRGSAMSEYLSQKLAIHPYGTVECAFGSFEMTDTMLSGLGAIPGISKLYYSSTGDFHYSVLTIYIEQ